MPTFRVYRDEEKVDELVGANEENLRHMFKKWSEERA
jgi:hypothetical protein